MHSSTIRFVYALLMALFVVTGAVGPAYAQSAPPVQFEEVRVVMEDGWKARGRHSAADDFVIVCPNYEVLDPYHPCSESSGGRSQLSRFDDLVLVCPVKDVLDSHPCANRRAQVFEAKPKDFVLVCPVKEVLDPHPCAEKNAKSVQFKIPGDYVMTCPMPGKGDLGPRHPCTR